MNGYRVIIYNPDDLEYIEGDLSELVCDNKSDIYRYQYLDGANETKITGATYTFHVSYPMKKQYIELDPTTMKRIAKYNKEVEIKKLDEEIEKKREQIKELDDKLHDRKQRWLSVKNYIANIYDMELNEDDEDNWNWED